MKKSYTSPVVRGSARQSSPLAWSLAAAILALSWQGSARGAGVVRDSIGPIPTGRGSTNIAHSDNLTVMNDNPAGLAVQDGLRLEVDLDLLYTTIHYQDPQNDTSNRDTIWPLPTALISLRFTEEPAPITVGLGFFMPAGFGAEYELVHPVLGNQKYLTQAGVFKLMPVLAVDLGKGFSAGAGFGFAYEQAKFQAPFTFNSLGGVPGLVDMDADGFTYCWNLGLQYRITDRWTVGVSYISETSVDLKGDFDLDISGLGLPIPDPTATYQVETTNTWPRSVGVGTTYLFEWGTLSLDFLWYNWSNAYKTLNFQLRDSDNPIFDILAGTTTPSDRLPLDWKDSVTVRIGGEYFITPDDTLRAGYSYMTSPIPNTTLTPLIPAILEHSISVGYGHRFGSLALDLAYQYSWGPRQDVVLSSVSNDYDNSSIRTMAHWFLFGANMKF